MCLALPIVFLQVFGDFLCALEVFFSYLFSYILTSSLN